MVEEEFLEYEEDCEGVSTSSSSISYSNLTEEKFHICDEKKIRKSAWKKLWLVVSKMTILYFYVLYFWE